jgi:hypothetical protein
MDIHTAEPLEPEPSFVEVEIAIGKLKRCKSPGTAQIPTELIKAGGEILYSEIHRLICCIWNNEELPQKWNESIIVPICKKCGKTDFKNYQGISLLSTAYKILSNILLARLTPYVNEIFGDHQCGFRRNRFTMDQIFYIRQIIKKNGSTMGQCISYLLTSRKPMTQLREKFFKISCLNLVYLRS